MSGFDKGDQVVLTLKGLGSVPARVLASSATTLELAALTAGASSLLAECAGPAVIELVTGRGVLRSEGSVQSGDVADGTCRVTVAGEPERVQRREFVRVDAVVPATVMLGERDAETADDREQVETWTVDASGAGFRLAGPEALALGEQASLEVRLPDGEPPLAVEAVVVRECDEGHRGVKIVEISRAGQQRLVHFVFERQRLARQLTRDG